MALLKGERPRTPWPPFLPSALTMSDPLIEEYLDDQYEHYLTLNRVSKNHAEQPAVNPFVQDWFDGQAAWHPVDWNKHAMRAVAGLVDDLFGARQLPLIVDFMLGHVVVFGASGWGKTTLIRSLIVSLAATHSPDEFHAHIFDLGGRNLEALRDLPHVGTIIMPDERGYEERVQQILREINDIVDERKRLFNEAGVSNLIEYNADDDHVDDERTADIGAKTDLSPPAETARNAKGVEREPRGYTRSGRKILPAILIAVDNFGEYIETFGDQTGKDDDNLLGELVALARQGKAYGIHFLITATRLNVLSSKLYSLFTERLTFKLSDATEYGGIVGSGAGELEEIAGRGLVRLDRRPLNFQVALPPGTVDKQGQVRGEARQVRLLAEKMNALLDQSSHRYQQPLRIDALPKASSFRQVLAELHDLRIESNFIDGLKAKTAQLWARNASAEEADWLYVTLGIASGKSELLMTLIVGLALNYSPDILNFVLVDYKGGGAFKPFEKLPHCVDIVTNLNKAAVDRMFTAINAEIRRRQRLNAETGTKDIVDYRRKGLHLTRDPYPHLFVIIDEYAEMIDDNPDYRAELESITRVGRAQGVNLLLASQRPKGVSDQMRANIKLRICLRVEELDTSREMLRRPDAALLPNGMPGRGYLQIGNENIELIQVSWTGEDQPDERDAPIVWPDRPAVGELQDDEEKPAFYDAAVNLSFELNNRQMAPKPWPSFLPETFSLQSTMVNAMDNSRFWLEPSVTNWLNGETDGLWSGIDWRISAMRPVVGLVDDPAEARQDPLIFDLTNTHLVIMGDSGWGKTTLLRTIMTSLAATHSPDELHMYVLDLGGRNFRSLEDLPHVGAVIYASDETYEERLNRLLDKLNRMVDMRQQFLSEIDAGSLYAYNERNPDAAWPAVLVMIDNFAELQENYEALVENTLLPLVRRSLSMGITFVATCNVPNNMPSKLYSLFGERVTFKQSNLDRYMDIVGRGAIEIDDIAGRGYIRMGGAPLFFHVAQPVGLYTEDDDRDTLSEGDEVRLLARHMCEYCASDALSLRTQPDPIAILEEIVPLQKMLTESQSSLSGSTLSQGRRAQAVLGQKGDFLPAIIDLKRMGPHFAVVGPPLSGKTTALYNWVLSLTSHCSPQQAVLILVDMQARFVDYGGHQRLDELPHVLASVTEIEQLEALMERVQNECEAMNQGITERELFVIIDNFDDFSEEIERQREMQRDLATMARRYGNDGLHFVIGGVLDGGTSEIRRRIQSSNYGIGLRNAQSVDALRVMRTPAGLRDKELPIGRGYIVKSGQATMIQVSTPYEAIGFNGSFHTNENGSNGTTQIRSSGAKSRSIDDSDEDDEKKTAALDQWIEQIKARYPEERAVWSDGVEATSEPATPQQSERAQHMMRLLQGVMHYELMEMGKNGVNGHSATAEFVQLEPTNWGNEEKLLALLKGFWMRQNGYEELPEETVALIVGDMSDEDYLHGVEQALAEMESG
ncbi:NACHT domain-containing protein [Chloroflexi bacterium TSY]|nr:NACHT domain-containing protein [Chloroflexi bacterium TSY]